VTTGAEPVQAPGWRLFARWHALIDAEDPRFVPLGRGYEVADRMADIADSIRVSMWNMQRNHSFRTLREYAGHDTKLRSRQVEIRYILPRRVAERRFPLASSSEPELRLAPVAHPLLIADGRLVVVGDSTGETVWTTTDPQMVADAVSFFDTVWSAAEPAVPEGEEPPYTPRMVEIAVHLVAGSTDREIARSLGVSERTVSSDVREMSRRLGARSRTHAIALISGVEG
jgi:DNA-binding CsgD family transcriptional regulator